MVEVRSYKLQPYFNKWCISTGRNDLFLFPVLLNAENDFLCQIISLCIRHFYRYQVIRHWLSEKNGCQNERCTAFIKYPYLVLYFTFNYALCPTGRIHSEMAIQPICLLYLWIWRSSMATKIKFKYGSQNHSKVSILVCCINIVQQVLV